MASTGSFVEDFRAIHPSDTRTDLQLIQQFGKPDSAYRGSYPTLGKSWDSLFRPSLSREFGRGLDRGIELTKGMGYGLAAYGADLVGFEDLRKDMVKGYQSAIQNTSLLRPTIDFTGAMKTGKMDDYIQWAAGGFGELIPNISVVIGGALLGGGAGALIGGGSRSALFKSANRALGSSLVGTLRKELGEEGAEKLLLGSIDKLKIPITMGMESALTGYGAMSAFKSPAFYGSQAGGMVSGIGLNLGEVYGGIVGDRDVNQENVTRAERLTIGGIGGVAAGLLDFMGPNLLLKRIFKRSGPNASATVGSRINRAFKALGAHMAVESTTEGMQEAIAEWAKLIADEDKVFDAELFKHHVTEAAALGGLAGFGFGMAGGTVELFRAPTDTTGKDEAPPSPDTAFEDVPGTSGPAISPQIQKLNAQTKLRSQYLAFVTLQRLAKGDLGNLTEYQQEQYHLLEKALVTPNEDGVAPYSRFLHWQTWQGFNELGEDGMPTGKTKDTVKVLSVASTEKEGMPMNRKRTRPVEFVSFYSKPGPHPAAPDVERRYRYMRIPRISEDPNDPGIRVLDVTPAEFELMMANPIPLLNVGVEIIREKIVDADGASYGRQALLNLKRIKGESWGSSERFDGEAAPSIPVDPTDKPAEIVSGDEPTKGFVDYGGVLIPMEVGEFINGLGEDGIDSSAAYIAGQIAMSSEPQSFTAPDVLSVEAAMNDAVFGLAEGYDTNAEGKHAIKEAYKAGKARRIPSWVVKNYFEKYIKGKAVPDGDLAIIDVKGAWPKHKFDEAGERVALGRDNRTVVGVDDAGKRIEFGWEKLQGEMFHPGMSTTFRDSLWHAFVRTLGKALEADMQADPSIMDAKSHLQAPAPGSLVAKFWEQGGYQVAKVPFQKDKAIKDTLTDTERPKGAMEMFLEDALQLPLESAIQFVNSISGISEDAKEHLIKAITTGDRPPADVLDILGSSLGKTPTEFKGLATDLSEGYEKTLNALVGYRRAVENHQLAQDRFMGALQTNVSETTGKRATSGELAELRIAVQLAMLDKLSIEELFLRNEIGKFDHTPFAKFLRDLHMGIGYLDTDNRAGWRNSKGEAHVVAPQSMALMDKKRVETGVQPEREHFSLIEVLAQHPETLDDMRSFWAEWTAYNNLSARQVAVNTMLEVARGAISTQSTITKADIAARYRSLAPTPLMANHPEQYKIYTQLLASTFAQADRAEYRIEGTRVMDDKFAEAVEQWDVFTSRLINDGLMKEIRNLTPEEASLVKGQYETYINDVAESWGNRFTADQQIKLLESLEAGTGVPLEIRAVKGYNEPSESAGMHIPQGEIEVPEGGERFFVGHTEAPSALTGEGEAERGKQVDLGEGGSISSGGTFVKVLRNDKGRLVYDTPMDILESLYFGKNLINVRSQGEQLAHTAQALDDGTYRSWRHSRTESELVKAFTDKTFVDKFTPLDSWETLNFEQEGVGFSKKKNSLDESKLAILAWDPLYNIYRLKSFSRVEEGTPKGRKAPSAKRLAIIPTHKVKEGDTVENLARKYGATATWLRQLNPDSKFEVGDEVKVEEAELSEFEIDDREHAYRVLDQLKVLSDSTPDDQPVLKSARVRAVNQAQADLDTSDFWNVAVASRAQAVKDALDFFGGWKNRKAELQKHIDKFKAKEKPTAAEKRMLAKFELELEGIQDSPVFLEEDYTELTQDIMQEAIKAGIGSHFEVDASGNWVGGGVQIRGLWEAIQATDFDPEKMLRIAGNTYNVPLIEGQITPEYMALAKTLREYQAILDILDNAADHLMRFDVATEEKKKWVTTEIERILVAEPTKSLEMDPKALEELRYNVSRSAIEKRGEVGKLMRDAAEIWKLTGVAYKNGVEADEALTKLKGREEALKQKVIALQRELEETTGIKPDGTSIRPHDDTRGFSDMTLRELTNELKQMFTAIGDIPSVEILVEVPEGELTTEQKRLKGLGKLPPGVVGRQVQPGDESFRSGTQVEIQKIPGRKTGREELLTQFGFRDNSARMLIKILSGKPSEFFKFWLGQEMTVPLKFDEKTGTGVTFRAPTYSTKLYTQGRAAGMTIQTAILSSAEMQVAQVTGTLEQPSDTTYASMNTARGAITRHIGLKGREAESRYIIEELDKGYKIYELKPRDGDDAGHIKVEKSLDPRASFLRNLTQLQRGMTIHRRGNGKGPDGMQGATEVYIALRAHEDKPDGVSGTQLIAEPGIWEVSSGPLHDFRQEIESTYHSRNSMEGIPAKFTPMAMSRVVTSLSLKRKIQLLLAEMYYVNQAVEKGVYSGTTRLRERIAIEAVDLVQQYKEAIEEIRASDVDILENGTLVRKPIVTSSGVPLLENMMDQQIPWRDGIDPIHEKLPLDILTEQGQIHITAGPLKHAFPSIQKLLGGISTTSEPGDIQILVTGVDAELGEIQAQLLDFMTHHRHRATPPPSGIMKGTNTFDVLFKGRRGVVRLQDQPGEGVDMRSVLLDMGYDPRLVPPHAKAGRLRHVFANMDVRGVVELQVGQRLDLQLTEDQVEKLVGPAAMKGGVRTDTQDWLMRFQDSLTDDHILINGERVRNPFVELADGKKTIANDLLRALSEVARQMETLQNVGVADVNISQDEDGKITGTRGKISLPKEIDPDTGLTETDEMYVYRMERMKDQQFSRSDFKASLMSIPGVVDIDDPKSRQKDFEPKFHAMYLEALQYSEGNRLEALNELLVRTFVRKQKGLYWGVLTEDQLDKVLDLPKTPPERRSFAMRGKVDAKALKPRHDANVLALRLMESLGLMTEIEASERYRENWGFAPEYMLEKMMAFAGETDEFSLDRYAPYRFDVDRLKYRDSDKLMPEKKAILHWLMTRQAMDRTNPFNMKSFTSGRKQWAVVFSKDGAENYLKKDGSLSSKVTPLLITKEHVTMLRQSEDLAYMYMRAKTIVPIGLRTSAQNELPADLIQRQRDLTATLFYDTGKPDNDASKFTDTERMALEDELADIREQIAKTNDIHAKYESAANHAKLVRNQLSNVVETKPYLLKGKMIDPVAQRGALANLSRTAEVARVEAAEALFSWTSNALFGWVNRMGYAGKKNLTGGRFDTLSLEEMISKAANQAEAELSGVATDSALSEIMTETAEDPDSEEAEVFSEAAGEMKDFVTRQQVEEARDEDSTLPGETEELFHFDETKDDFFDVFPKPLVNDLYQSVSDSGIFKLKDLPDMLSKIKKLLRGDHASSKDGIFSRSPFREYILKATKDIFIAEYGTVHDMLQALDFKAVATKQGRFNPEALTRLLNIETQVIETYAEFFAKAISESRKTVLISDNEAQYQRILRNFGLEPEAFNKFQGADAVTGIILERLNILLSEAPALNAKRILDAIYLLEGRKFHRLQEDGMVKLESLQQQQRKVATGKMTPDGDFETVDQSPESINEDERWKIVNELMAGGMTQEEAEAEVESGVFESEIALRTAFLGRMRVQGPLEDLKRYTGTVREAPQDRALLTFMIDETQTEIRKLRQQLYGAGPSTRGIETGREFKVPVGQPLAVTPEAQKSIGKEIKSKLRELQGYYKSFGQLPAEQFTWMKNKEGQFISDEVTMADIIRHHFPQFFTQFKYQQNYQTVQYGYESPIPAKDLIVGDTRTIVMAPAVEIPDLKEGGTKIVPDMTKRRGPFAWWKFQQIINSGQFDLAGERPEGLPEDEAKAMGEPMNPEEWLAYNAGPGQGLETPTPQWVPVRGSEPVQVQGVGPIIPDDFWSNPTGTELDLTELIWEGPMFAKGAPMQGIVWSQRGSGRETAGEPEAALNKVTDVLIGPNGKIWQGGPYNLVREGAEAVPSYMSLGDFFSQIIWEGTPLARHSEAYDWVYDDEAVSADTVVDPEFLVPGREMDRLRLNEVNRLGELLTNQFTTLRQLEREASYKKDPATGLKTEGVVEEGEGRRKGEPTAQEATAKAIEEVQERIKETQARRDFAKTALHLRHKVVRKDQKEAVLDWGAINDAGYFIGRAIRTPDGSIFFTSSLRDHSIIIPSGGTWTYTHRITMINQEFTDEEAAWERFNWLMEPLNTYRKRVSDTKQLREIQMLGGRGLLLETETGDLLAEAANDLQQAAADAKRAKDLLEKTLLQKKWPDAKLVEEQQEILDRASRRMTVAEEQLRVLSADLPQGIKDGTTKDPLWLSEARPMADSTEMLNPLALAFQDMEDRLGSSNEQVRWFGDLFDAFHGWLTSERGRSFVKHDRERGVIGTDATLTRISEVPEAEVIDALSDMGLQALHFGADPQNATAELLLHVLTTSPIEDVMPVMKGFQEFVVDRYGDNSPVHVPEAHQAFAQQFAEVSEAVVWKHLTQSKDRSAFGAKIIKELENPTTDQQVKAHNLESYGPDVPISFFDPVQGMVHPDGTVTTHRQGLGADVERAHEEATEFISPEALASWEEVKVEDSPFGGDKYQHRSSTLRKVDGRTLLDSLVATSFTDETRDGSPRVKLAEHLINFMLKADDLGGGKILKQITAYISPASSHTRVDDRGHYWESHGLSDPNTGDILVHTKSSSYETTAHEVVHQLFDAMKTMNAESIRMARSPLEKAPSGARGIALDLEKQWKSVFVRAKREFMKDAKRLGFKRLNDFKAGTWTLEAEEGSMGHGFQEYGIQPKDAHDVYFMSIMPTLELIFTGETEIDGTGADELLSWMLTNPDVLTWMMTKEGIKRDSLYQEAIDIIIKWLKAVARALGINVPVDSLGEEAYGIALDIARHTIDHSESLVPGHNTHTTKQQLKRMAAIPGGDIQREVPVGDVPENINSSLVSLAIARRDMGHVLFIAGEAGLSEEEVYQAMNLTGRKDPRTKMAVELQNPHYKTAGFEDTAFVDGDMSEANNDEAIRNLKNAWSYRLSKLIDQYVEDKSEIEALEAEVDNLTDELEVIHGPGRFDAENLLKGIGKRMRETIKRATLEGQMEALSRGSYTLAELRQMLMIHENMTATEVTDFLTDTMERLARLENIKPGAWPRSVGKYFNAMAQLSVDYDNARLTDIRGAIQDYTTDSGFLSLNSTDQLELGPLLEELNAAPKLRAVLSAVAQKNSRTMNMFNVRIMRNEDAKQKLKERIEKLEQGEEDFLTVRNELLGEATARRLKQAERLILNYTKVAQERAKKETQLVKKQQFMETYEKVILLVDNIEKEYADQMGAVPEFTTIEKDGSFGQYFVMRPGRVEEGSPAQILIRGTGGEEVWSPIKSRHEMVRAYREWKAQNKVGKWTHAGLHQVDMDLHKKPEERERFLEHLSYNTAWLRDNEHMRGKQLYRQVQNMNAQLLGLNIRKNLFEIRANGAFEGLTKTLEAPLQTLGRAGSTYAWELRRRLLIYQNAMLQYTPEAHVHAGKFMKHFRLAAIAGGYDNDHVAFDHEILTPIEIMLNRSPHLTTMEGALEAASEYYIPKMKLRLGGLRVGADRELASINPVQLQNFEKAMANLLNYARINGRWFNSVRDGLGIGVERRGSYTIDEITGQVKTMVGRAAEKGWFTTPLRLARLRVFHDFKLLESTAEGAAFVKLMTEVDTEQVLADPNFAEKINSDVVEILIRPLFTEFERLRPFGDIDWEGSVPMPPEHPDAPPARMLVEELLVKRGVPIEAVPHMTSLKALFNAMVPSNDTPGAQVANFIETVAHLIEQDTSLEDLSLGDRRGKIINKIKSQYGDIKNLKINAETTEDPNVFNPGAGHFIIDARTNPWIPSKYYERAPMDQVGQSLSVKKLAITAAFGRDTQEGERLFQKLMTEMNERLHQVQKEFGEQSNEAKKYESFWRAIADENHGVRGRLNRIYNSKQGEMADLPAFMEGLGLVVQGTLAGPRSWLVQSQSQTILPYFMGGWTKESRRALWQSFKTFGKSIVSDWGKGIGSDLVTLSREEQYMKDLLFQTQFESMDWDEYALSDPGYRYAYQRKTMGFNLQRTFRLMSKRLNKGVALMPWNGFKVWSKTTTLGNAMGLIKVYMDSVRTLADYFKRNPDVNNNPGFSIIDEPALLKELYGKNTRGVEFLAIRSLDYLGKTIDETARDMVRQGDLGNSLLTENMLRGFLMMSQNEITGDGSINARPYWTKTNELGRLSGVITGWSLWQTQQFAHTGRDNADKVRWGWMLMNMGLTVLPVALAWGMALDMFDEKVRGKAPYRRKFSSDLSMWKNVQAAIDRIDATGTMGQWGSAMNVLANYTNPRHGMGRGVGLERIFVWSVLGNAYKSLQKGFLQGGFDWQTVTRGIPGLAGPMQWLQVSNQFATSMGMPPISSAEKALTDKLNAKRYLLAAGEQMGLELKAPIMGIPTRQSYYTSLMYRAALEDDSEAFREYYMAAIDRYGEVSDTPEKSVKASWASRHPMKNIFRFQPDSKQQQRLFRIMGSTGRDSVNQALRLYEKYDRLISGYTTSYGSRKPMG